jgi:hypothetical protein
VGDTYGMTTNERTDIRWVSHPRPAHVPTGKVWIPGTTIVMDAPEPGATPADPTVAAEAAPIGVQLWPTRHPKYAPNFTLAEVKVTGDHVTWIYQNGKTRHFNVGEQVTVRYS